MSMIAKIIKEKSVSKYVTFGKFLAGIPHLSKAQQHPLQQADEAQQSAEHKADKHIFVKYIYLVYLIIIS